VVKTIPNLSAAVVVVLLLVGASVAQTGDGQLDNREQTEMIQRVESSSQPQPVGFEDDLFTAARAVQEHFNDPLRALALYRRIMAEYPNSRVALAASRRAAMLEESTAGGAANVAQVQAFASLQQSSDVLSASDVFAQGEALRKDSWPGAPEVALWLGEFAQRKGQLDKANQYFGYTRQHWPASRQSQIALHAQASVAVQLHDYDSALFLATQMDVSDSANAVLQQGIVADARRGLRLRWWMTPALIAVAMSLLVLIGSWWTARRRCDSDMRSSLKPTLEVWFLAPVVALFFAASLTANVAIAPAVALVSGYGIVATWLAGIAFRQAQAGTAQPPQVRAAVHCIACILGTVGIMYVALMRQGLLITLFES
jgi:hypothetical protein